METESDSDNVNPNMFADSSSVERIKNDYGALRCILSKTEFGDLLQARLVCRNWKKESEFFIRRRVKVDLNTDCRLKEYLNSDRTTYPSIELDVGELSTEVLAECDLKGVQELLIKTTGPKRNGRVINASNKWLGYLKNKFLKLFQQENNLTSLDLVLTHPITFTAAESDSVRIFPNIRRLSFTEGENSNLLNLDSQFQIDGIGSILVCRCTTLEYLTMEVYWAHLTFNHLLNMLNERMDQGHTLPILSLQPQIRVGPYNFREFNQFVNLGPRFEILDLHIECGDQQHFINDVIATEQLLDNTADVLTDLHLDFFNVGHIINQPEITIPSLPKLQNLKIGAKMSVDGAFQFIQLIPTNFPCLKELEFTSGWDTFSISGKVFPNLDRLLIGCSHFSYIPDSPPTFPFLREIALNMVPVTEAFLRFTFTHLTSVRNMRIQLPSIYAFDEEYFDAWNIFTGGAQPPAYVLPSPNVNDLGMVEVENDAPGQVADAGNAVNDEVNVNDGNPALMGPRPSLQNLTNLRDLYISRAAPRDIQAITYMTQLKMMEKLDKLEIHKYKDYEEDDEENDEEDDEENDANNFDDFPRCKDILKGYHCLVKIHSNDAATYHWE